MTLQLKIEHLLYYIRLENLQVCIMIYSCPMKTHHSSDAHICVLSQAVENCVIVNYYLGQMRCFRTKVSIQVALLKLHNL